MSHEGDSQFISLRSNQNWHKPGMHRNYGNNSSENYPRKYLNNSKINENRRNGQILYRAKRYFNNNNNNNNNKNNNNDDNNNNNNSRRYSTENYSQRENYHNNSYARQNYNNNSYERQNYNNERFRYAASNYNNQRFNYERQNESWKFQHTTNISFNEKDFICSTFRDTPKTCTQTGQKKSRTEASQKESYTKASQKESYTKASQKESCTKASKKESCTTKASKKESCITKASQKESCTTKASQKESCTTKASQKKTCTKKNQKKTSINTSQKKVKFQSNKEKTIKQNTSTSNHLLSSIIVDPLPSVPESNSVSKDASNSEYICKTNLEFRKHESPTVSKSSSNKTFTNSLRKRRFSQSSTPSEVSQSSRKRNVSAVSSSQPVLNQKKFKEDLSLNEFKVFEKTLKVKNNISSPPSKVESIKEKDTSSSLPEPQWECKNKIKRDISNDVCNNKDLEYSQPFTPSIPCGQVQKKDIDELDCPTQDDHISLDNFFSQTNSSQLSLNFEEDVKSKELHCPQGDNNITSLFRKIDEPNLQTHIQNSFSIVENVEKSAINYYDSVFSASPSKEKLPKKRSLTESQNNLCDESEFIPSSQECVSTPNVLLNIESLKNLSRSMSEKKSLSPTFQDSADISALGKENSTEYEEPATGKKEFEDSASFLNPCTPHPLTSTQYGPKRRNLYTPQMSPLTTNEQDNLISSSFVDLAEHSNDSVAICENKNRNKNDSIACATLSTQPFENDQTNETGLKKNFESIKLKVEKLFNIVDDNDEQTNNTVVEVTNKKNENSEQLDVNIISETVCDTGEEILVPAPESSIDRPKIPQDCKNLEDTFKSCEENEGVPAPESSIDRPKILQDCKNLEDTFKSCEKNEGLTLSSEDVNNSDDKNVKCKDNNSGENNSQNDKITHEDTKKKDTDNNFIQNEEKLDEKLLALKKKFCDEYDIKVGYILDLFKNLFKKQKENYLNQHISTTFNIKIKTIEGSDLQIEKKSFKLPDFNEANYEESQNTKNITEINIFSNQERYSLVKGENNFVYFNPLFPNDNIGEKNIVFKDRATKTMKKKKNKIINSKNKETVKNEYKNKTVTNKLTSRKYWWRNYAKAIPDSDFEPSNEDSDYDEDSVMEDLYNSDSESNQQTEDSESESGSVIKKKKKICKKHLKSKESVHDNDEDQYFKGEICADSPITFDVKAPMIDLQITPKENIKSYHSQHLICLNELSRNNDPYLSNVKKTLKKKLKRNMNSQKTLTPPFQFKKLETKPGKRRTLLNNVNSDN